MTAEDVKREICEVFATPMGLEESDIKNNQLFPFTYLQKTGAGTRSLHIPAVKDTFEWSAKQVASLAKSSNFIYFYWLKQNCRDIKDR